MGEVHDVHQPEDQREPDGDKPVEQPHQEAARQALDDGLGCHDRCSGHVIARSEATKQSILSLRGTMDCFASLAMTERGSL